jgi:magnesium transporter
MKRFDQELNDFQWTDCEAPSPADLLTLSQEFEIPLHTLNSSLDPENLPRCEFLPESTLVIFRVYDSAAKFHHSSIQELTTKLIFFIQEKRILTLHRSQLRFLDEKKEKCPFEKDLSRKTFLKFLISQSILSFDNPLTEIEHKSNQIEERVFALKRTRILRDGYLIKRRVSTFKKVFRFTSEVLNKMSSHQELIWTEFQDILDLINRYQYYADDDHENITGLLNLHISLLSQKTNEASFKTNEIMRVLTVFSIFFLPLNFIAGVYGMNFQNMPELKTEHGYFLVLLAMLIISLAIFIWVYRRGWMAKPEDQ